MSRRRSSVFLLIGGALAALAICWWAFLMREYHSWREAVRFRDGTVVDVWHDTSDRAYHGHPHLLGWGGGDPRHEIRFVIAGGTFIWRGAYIPIVLDHHQDAIYLAVFDRETDFGRPTFRLYQTTAGQP